MKILVVEDEKLLAESVKALLEEKKYEVDAVYDGETGLDYAETGVYDLIILDVMMPKMNGYQVARRLRKEHTSTPILMLTAKSEILDRVEGLNSGADYYLTKPFARYVCERRDLNPYAEALDPKSSVYANFTTLAIYRHRRTVCLITVFPVLVRFS